VVNARYAEARNVLGEAPLGAGEQDDPQGHVEVRGTEALAAIFLGDDTRASEALEQQLRIARDAEYLEPLDEALLIAAALAARRGTTAEAACWRERLTSCARRSAAAALSGGSSPGFATR
jgi:hypothetical protein